MGRYDMTVGMSIVQFFERGGWLYEVFDLNKIFDKFWSLLFWKNRCECAPVFIHLTVVAAAGAQFP